MYFPHFLFKVHEREIIEYSDVGWIRETFMIDVFDKFKGLFVSVNEGEGIILWIHCQKLWKKPKHQWWKYYFYIYHSDLKPEPTSSSSSLAT